MDKILERDISKYLVKRVKNLGGFTRRLQWIGVSGAPDMVVFLNGAHFVELKAPTGKCTPLQLAEFDRIHRMGKKVHVVYTYEQVDALLVELT